MPQRTRFGQPGSGARLCLAGEFQLLIDGAYMPVPHGVQRLLAYLGMTGRPVARSRVAGELWQDVTEGRALGNLRSSLWRLRRIPRPLVQMLDDSLALDADVAIDLLDFEAFSNNLRRQPREAILADLQELTAAAELLPGWEDEWLVVERERFHELRLHALEGACAALIEAGDYSDAVQAALAAIDGEPYRESAQRLLITAYLHEGNAAAGLRAYDHYRKLIADEMGIVPSEAMERLLAGVRRLPGAGRSH